MLCTRSHKIKYVIYTKINDFFYVNKNGECILEIYHKDIFFKSDIKKNHPNFTYKEKVLFIKNLQNQNKIIESNPVFIEGYPEYIVASFTGNNL